MKKESVLIGKSWVGSMEIRRLRAKRFTSREWWTLSAYRAINGYGGNYLRAFGVLIGLLVVFAGLFMLIGFKPSGAGEESVISYDFTLDPTEFLPCAIGIRRAPIKSTSAQGELKCRHPENQHGFEQSKAIQATNGLDTLRHLAESSAQ